MEENELRKEDAEDTLVLCGVVGGCAGLGTCLGRYKMCTLPREDAKSLVVVTHQNILF